MSEQENDSDYFNDSLKIHAICVDMNLSETDARILTYMHAKGIETGKGAQYFLNPANEDSEALEIMLGQKTESMQLASDIILDEKTQEALDLITTIADRISHIDNLLAKECGLENRLTGELRNRLRLYKDQDFRNHMIDLYSNHIMPQLPEYDQEKIENAFSRFRALERQKEKDLLNMVGIKF